MRESALTHGFDPTVAGRSDLLKHIGRTPLLRLERIASELPAGVELHGKAEHLNPSGSLKDRSVLGMILAATASGRLRPGQELLDATSGNAGIAYAMVGAALGYGVTLCLPGNASIERKRMLKAYGARILETDPAQGSDGAQLKARELHGAAPGRYFHMDQYNNDANWQAHYQTTGPEIWRQTNGQITHFVTGLGTSGTFMGVSRRLKEYNPAIQCMSMQPDSALHGLEGLKYMPTALVPGIYDPKLADDQIEIDTEHAHDMVVRLAREEGLMVGVSSGANLVAALRVASGLKEGVVVTIFCDSAARYLSEEFWRDLPPKHEKKS